MAPTYWSEMDAYHILNFFSMHAAGHLLINPEADPDQLLKESVEMITGPSHPENAKKLLAALELIRDARSGDTWSTYWWREKDYILLCGDYAPIHARADEGIAQFETLLQEEEPTDGIPFPLSRKNFYRLIQPHLYQIRQFAQFRVEYEELKKMKAALVKERKRLEEQVTWDLIASKSPEFKEMLEAFKAAGGEL